MISTLLKTMQIVLLLGLAACGQASVQTMHIEDQTYKRPPVVQTATDVVDQYLDSAAIEQFIAEHKLESRRADQIRRFYESRDYQYAWFDNDGLAQQARSFWNMHNHYRNYAKDSSFFNEQLHRHMKELLDDEEVVQLSARQTRVIELELTEHFFDYAQYAFEGKINPDEIRWHIPRKKVNAVALLDSLISRNGQQMDDWEPVNQQYKLVRKELIRLYGIQKQGGWPRIEGGSNVYRAGDSAEAIVSLKQRLRIAGDLSAADDSPVFTQELQNALKRAQKRMGLKADGVAGPNTLKALNIPVQDRIEQLLVNMERMRWMPKETSGKRLVANIPEFRLHIMEDDRKIFDMKIVVGKAVHKTVVFNDELKHIVFSPYWNIPRSIVRNEILPAMKKNPGYLGQQNMEQTGTSGGLPVIRQKPGAGNALGRVKFLFPNSYAIYFHDTPAKSLFDRTQRAFSHGCIRLEEPKKLAAYLLQHRSEWTDSRISNAMYAGSEKWVTLKEPVPVVISYFTAWVDEAGVLQYRDDIYGHDKALANKLFQH